MVPACVATETIELMFSFFSRSITLMIRMSAQRSTVFDDLNEQQRAAVDHTGGPLLVIAGAGSGKTKTLSTRVARLVRDGVDPRRILLLTFSRRAATDMIKRAGATIAEATGVANDVDIPWAGTFHAIGARILREMAPLTGLSPDFTIHDRSDSADLMGLVRHDLGLDRTAKRFPQKATCLSIYSRAINAEEPLADALTHYPWCGEWGEELNALFAGYVEAKQSQSVLDYDDLLLYWAELMETLDLGSEIASRFDHVLVDEYQDTNLLQARIVAALAPDGVGVTVVGDDAQSIYSFRAATVRNILDFPNAYSPAARVVTLEQNYRSTEPILAASNAVIALSSERYCKELKTTRRAASVRASSPCATKPSKRATWLNASLKQESAGLRSSSRRSSSARPTQAPSLSLNSSVATFPS